VRFAVNRISIVSNTIGELKPWRQEGSSCGRTRPRGSGNHAVRFDLATVYDRLTPWIDLSAPSPAPIHHRISNRVSRARYVRLWCSDISWSTSQSSFRDTEARLFTSLMLVQLIIIQYTWPTRRLPLTHLERRRRRRHSFSRAESTLDRH